VKDPPVTELALVLTSCTSLSPKKEEDSTEAATLFVNASTRYESIGDVKFTLGAVQFTETLLIPTTRAVISGGGAGAVRGVSDAGIVEIKPPHDGIYFIVVLQTPMEFSAATRT